MTHMLSKEFPQASKHHGVINRQESAVLDEVLIISARNVLNVKA